MMKRQARQLWELCFEDSKEFNDLYFEYRYSDSITSCIYEDGMMVSALQRIPYPMSLYGEIIDTAYISGACTHPEYRSKGLMRELLDQAHRTMHSQGKLLSTLIPANEGLFGYYARSGYVSCFRYRRETFTPSVQQHDPGFRFVRYNPAEAGTESLCGYLFGEQRRMDACILHPYDDYNVILKDLELGNGSIYAGFDSDGRMCAMALVSDSLVHEVVAESGLAKEGLLNHICRTNGINSLVVNAPADGRSGMDLGMARIIDVPGILSLYSRAKGTDMVVEIFNDTCISSNNGIFRAAKGEVTPIKGSSPDIRMGIEELASLIFKGMTPYMSLMLN